MKTLVGYVTGIIALLIIGYVVLAALGKPTNELLSFLFVILGQAAGAVALLVKQNTTDQKVDNVTAKVDKVAEQTNGHLTTLINAAIHSTPVEPVETKEEGTSNAV